MPSDSSEAFDASDSDSSALILDERLTTPDDLKADGFRDVEEGVVLRPLACDDERLNNGDSSTTPLLDDHSPFGLEERWPSDSHKSMGTALPVLHLALKKLLFFDPDVNASRASSSLLK